MSPVMDTELKTSTASKLPLFHQWIFQVVLISLLAPAILILADIPACGVCLINSNPTPSCDLRRLCQSGTTYFSDLNSETLTSSAHLSFLHHLQTEQPLLSFLQFLNSGFLHDSCPCPYYFIWNSLHLSGKFPFIFLTHYSLFNLDYHCSLTFFFVSYLFFPWDITYIADNSPFQCVHFSDC